MASFAKLLVGSLALTASWMPVVSAHPATHANVKRVSPPASDPFYQPPAGFKKKKPGTILKQRKVTTAFLGLIPFPVESYQLLYRTTAINGSAIATVTTVFKPLIGVTPDSFISFATAYDSSATICQPSYTYQLGAPQNDLITSIEELIISAYLANGYIVASPDYEGPDAAFSPGRLEGMGVLDGMRAVSNFGDTLGFTVDPRIVGTGYSGGAIATSWAASLQPKYAPELDIRGWAMGGTPANLTGTLTFIDNTLFSGFLPASVAGLIAPSAYGAELKPLVQSIATARGREVLEYAASHCATDVLLYYPNQSILDPTFQTLGPRLLYDPTVARILKENTLALKKSETPTAPVFIYHATNDEIIPYSNASTLVNSWCANGADVNFVTFANGGHLTSEIVALPSAIKFAKAAFADNAGTGCTTSTEYDDSLDPLALGLALEPIAIQLIQALTKLGKDDSKLNNNLNTIRKSVSPQG